MDAVAEPSQITHRIYSRTHPNRVATDETWEKVREDYVLGKGSPGEIQERHNVTPSSFWSKAKRDRWGEIRSAREASELARLRGEQPAVARALEQTSEEMERPGGSRWYGKELGRYRGQVSVLREQVERLHGLLSLETDPQGIDRLSLSIDRMEERIRIILGQPLPPKLKDLSTGKPSAKPVIQVD